MNELRELYQQVIIDHSRKPRNFSVLSDATHQQEGFNPLCGDKVTVYLKMVSGVVTAVSFQGSGCAISLASASLMTEALVGKTTEQVQQLFEQFHQVLTDVDKSADELGKLAVLKGVAEFPARVKCATLAWHTMVTALK